MYRIWKETDKCSYTSVPKENENNPSSSVCVSVCLYVCVYTQTYFKAAQKKKSQNPQIKKQTSTRQHFCICHNGFWVWEIRKYNDAQRTQWPYKLLICVWKCTSFLAFLPSLCRGDTRWQIMRSCHRWASRVQLKCNIIFSFFIGTRYCCSAAAYSWRATGGCQL